MLGFHVSIYQQADGGEKPATADSKTGARLAVWQTGYDGLQWIDELVEAGKAISLGGSGYPSRYTTTADNLIPRIVDRPPGARATWAAGPSDIITEKWEGKTVLDASVAKQCRPEKWLLIEAWDES